MIGKIKLAAYENILEKMKKVDSKATIDIVKSKINTIRCTFEKELSKLKSSQKSGSGVDDIYVPKLWYYNLFPFLIDQEEPGVSQSNRSIDDEETTKVSNLRNF